jgi:hypothetical protein
MGDSEFAFPTRCSCLGAVVVRRGLGGTTDGADNILLEDATLTLAHTLSLSLSLPCWSLHAPRGYSFIIAHQAVAQRRLGQCSRRQLVVSFEFLSY